MADNRPLVAKLEAMAQQTVSPHEADVARGLLEKLVANRANPETRRSMSRADILGAPDDFGAGSVHTITVHYKHTTLVMHSNEFELLFPTSYFERIDITTLGPWPAESEFIIHDRPSA